jgi:hypothetical protein
MLLDEKQVVETLHEILRDLARRHRNITPNVLQAL